MAVDRLREEEPRAVDLLNLCAFLAPEAIPRRLLTEHHAALPHDLGDAVADPLRLNRLVGALRRYSLVEVTGEALSFHRLVQAAARDALTGRPASLGRGRRGADARRLSLRPGRPCDLGAVGCPARPCPRRRRPCRGDGEDLEDARWLLNQTARLLRNARRVRAGKGRLRAGTGTCGGCPWPGRPRSGGLRQQPGRGAASPGRSGGRQGGLRAGAPDRRGELRARTIRSSRRDVNHPRARQQPGAARGVLDLGDLAGARAAFERALAIDEASFGPDHPNVATASTTWALCCKTWAIWRAPGRPSSARSDRRGELRPRPPQRRHRRQQPGHCAARPGRSGGRQGGLRARAPDRRGELRARPPQRRHRRQQPGRVLQDLGDLAGARAAFERALRIDEASFGPDHPNVATVNNLGSCCKTWAIWRAPGRPTSGRSRSTRRASAPTTPTSPQTSTTWAWCCKTWAIWRAPGRPSSGRSRIDEASFGPDHPNVATDVNNLGLVLQDLGDLAGARAAFERALADRRGELRPRPPRRRHQTSTTWACCKTWAIWRAPGRPSSGRCGSTRRASGPTTPTSPQTSTTWARCCKTWAIWRAPGRPSSGRSRIDEASFGPDHPNVATDVNNLGGVLQDLGDLAGARAAFERALAIFERVLGPDHPNTRTVRGNLESLGGG